MSDGNPEDVFDGLDVLSRARRDALRPGEARDLARALTTSALVRTAHEVGRSFDVQSGVRAGDDTLIARAASAALARGPRRPSARARWLLAVAATWLVGTAAAATVAVVVARGGGAEVARNVPVPMKKTPAPAHSTAHAAARGKAMGSDGANDTARGETAPNVAARDETAPDVAARDDNARDETAPNVAARPRHHVVTPPEPTARGTTTVAAPGALGSAPDATGPATRSAADLFRDASAARRTGDLVRARALYAELQARFPHTREARVSLVSLGTLLLAAGRAGEADAAFGAYLDGGPGDLTEEALVGRAGACAALGRHAEERGAWTKLLERFPTSVYVARAQARLATLDPASHASAGTH